MFCKRFEIEIKCTGQYLIPSFLRENVRGRTEVNFGLGGCNGPLGRYVIIINPWGKLCKRKTTITHGLQPKPRLVL